MIDDFLGPNLSFIGKEKEFYNGDSNMCVASMLEAVPGKMKEYLYFSMNDPISQFTPKMDLLTYIDFKLIDYN